MKRSLCTIWTLCCLLPGLALGAEANYEKTISAAVKAGDFTKAKQLCEAWIEKKPTDERPHVILGRIYVKTNMTGKAIEAFEMARAFNPLNPEPICEEGKIFLEAGNAEEAIEEFQAALEVRKDYAPAVKGLAAAEALRDNPYANGVRVRLGISNEDRGLRQHRPERGRAATIGGRKCKAIDIAADGHHMYFNVDDKYLFDVDLPVQVTVEYYDLGTRQFLLKYDSSDSGAHWHGSHKRSERAIRTDTKTWKTHTFSLQDARFANRTLGADLALYAGREDLNVASVHIVQSGLGVSVEPRIAVPGGTCTVTATVVDSQGPVPDGAPVSFSTDQGVIAAEVKTIAGQAKARFEAGAEAGEAVITVEAGTCKRVVHIPVVHGLGNIVQRRLVLDRFDGKTEWEVGTGRPAQGTLEQLLQGGPDGQPTLRLTYHFGRDGSSGRVSLSQPMLVPGRPISLGIRVKQDGSRSVLSAEFVDATGQTHCYALGDMASTGWRTMEQDIGQASEHHGGANDGRLHLPLRFQRLFLRPSYSRKARKAGESEICFRDLTVVTEVPESGTTLVDARPRRASFVFDAEEAPVCHVDLSNLTNTTLEGRLQWLVADEEGQTVAEGTTDIQIAAEERISREVAARLTAPGLYRARFTFEPGGEKGETQPALPPAEAAFLLLRDIAKLDVSADTVVTAKGLTLRLSNQGDGATQFGLSYRVLDQKRQVMRGGSLGQPNMELKPGEVIDYPLSFEGLPPDRYSVMLFFDMADGERYTKLLSHDLLPSEGAMAVRVTDEQGSPIPGARVRARLVRRRHRHLFLILEGWTTHTWEAQTDEDGRCSIANVPVPPDVDLHRVYVDVVADGFVDRQLTSGLRTRLALGGRAPRLARIRMSPGRKLVGRVIGADGEPALNARVHAVSSPVMRPRFVGEQYYRPRTTDADGRFELFVVPEREVLLTIHTSQWAPRSVTVPAGGLDAGNVQLESGATVSGTLLDEQGRPAAGYWVVAETAAPPKSPILLSPTRVAAKTEPDGTFKLPPLKGEFTLCTPASFRLWQTEASKHSPRPKLAILPQTHTLDRNPVESELRAVPQVRIAGRVLDVDGTPAKDVSMTMYCRQPGCRLMFDAALTDGGGRFAFEGIPRGLSDLTVTGSSSRPWKRAERIYLRAKPLAYVKGRHEDGSVHLDQLNGDLPDADFQFQFWSPEKGFLGTEPKKEPNAAEE